MAADDVATGVSKIAQSAPINGTVEIAGLEPFRFDELSLSQKFANCGSSSYPLLVGFYNRLAG
jgi:hypothetical protein